MNIDTAIFMQKEKIRRFPNSIEAKKFKFYEEHSDIIDALRDIKSWNDFAASLVNQFDTKGQLTEPQLFSASAMLMKIKSNAEERAAKKADQKKNMLSLDVSKILAILDKTEGVERRYSNGREYVTKKVQFPKVRVGDLVFSKASESSKNAGAVYIKYQKEYIGKVLGGYYLPVNSPSDEVISEIKSICKDPLDSAIAYGKRTGNCAVCSRDLTRHDSIDRGIGPICAERLGIL
jgi:ribosomal protein L35AE/L33A